MWLFRAQMTTLSDNNLTFLENFFLHKIERKKKAKFVPVQLTENEINKMMVFGVKWHLFPFTDLEGKTTN